ncbi:MAG: helix-turn-helix transcriptional regulator [Candidatus Kapaibacteriota bacterium]
MPGQPHRILYMYKKFLAGETLTSTQLQDMISEEIEIVSIRTIQRDLRLLQKIEPTLVGTPKGKEIYWRIPKYFLQPKQVVRFETNELLAFHFLKAHLKTFRGTVIERDVEKLYNKLEKFAPKEVILDDTIYWDQNVGYYDYSKINDILKKVIECTASKKWYTVTYVTPKTSTSKDIVCRFETIFSYLGVLYVVAYVPKHKVHVSLAIHNISKIEENPDVIDVAPPFNFREWSSYRFGVFSGETRDVKLLVKKEFIHFFLNRRWHISQVEKLDKDGNLILEMRVPIGVDLINWILSWSDAIIVLEPKELIQKIVNRLTQALSNYKTTSPEIKPQIEEIKEEKFETGGKKVFEEQTPPETKPKEVVNEPRVKYKLSLKKKKN